MTDMATEIIRSFEERWHKLTIANDFVFCKAMPDADLCREVLETILDIDIDRIEYVGRQEQLDASPEGKAVRLDVYVRDDSGTVFNVEMQSTNTRELPRRARYYHSLMAIDQLTRGASYRSLGDAYVIFICNFDLFGEGQRVYTFENTCCTSRDLRLGDGAKTIFLSANAPQDAEESPELNELLDYVASGEVTGELSARLAVAVANVLDNQKWRLEYMMLEVRDQLNFDRGKDEGYEKGREEGLERGREEGLAQGREAGLAEGREVGLAEGREVGLAEGRKAGLAEGREVGLAEGREAGIAEGHAAGMAEGHAMGVAEGEQRLARLVAALLADDRQDDVAGALTDLAMREVLYKKYAIA